MARHPRDLITPAEVRRFYGITGVDEGIAEIDLEELCTAASDEAYKITGREFIALNAVFTNPGNPDAGLTIAPERRVLRADGTRRLSIGDVAELVAIRYGNPASVVDHSTWIMHPLGRSPSVHSIRSLEYGPSFGYAEGTLLDVEARWGFPAVPRNVRHWVKILVCIWLERHVSTFSETFNRDEQRVERPRSVPSAVYDGLIRWAGVGPLFA